MKRIFLCLLAVSLLADGGIDKAVVASVAKAIAATEPEGMEALRAIFRNQSLQMLLSVPGSHLSPGRG